MALIEQQKRQQTLIIGLVVIVAATAVVLYFGKFRQQGISVEVSAPFASQTISTFSLPQNLFTNKTFLNLTMYPPVVAPSSVGRENPFK
ncbi:MAG: hypothetical protein HYV65_03760 [Candidatus Spechtbacteria bacterium]|nr:hypothetical protein [Candidatus Spechtbacteria bacterium]